MKSSYLILGLLAISGSLHAENYPAANFEPKVVYQDQSLITQAETASNKAADPRYPATNFQPKVLFRDKQAMAMNQFDPDFPAAYFQPKVIYP
ncbi:MAG: hypothetical protein RQ715_05135 [Methylococcales bacterium]|nr:hypothetical protein [Methylococcales bacterium]